MATSAWSIVAVIAFWAWVGSCFVFIFKMFPKRQIFDTRQAILWGLLSLLFGIVWFVGLSKS